MALSDSRGRTTSQRMVMTMLFAGVLTIGLAIGWQTMKPSPDAPTPMPTVTGSVSLADQKVIYGEFRTRVKASDPMEVQASTFDDIAVAHHLKGGGQLLLIIKEGDHQQWAGPGSGPSIDGPRLIQLAMAVRARHQKASAASTTGNGQP